MSDITWDQLKDIALTRATERGLGDEYTSRLTTEIKEIEKQGAPQYYIRLYNDNFKYETNVNGLVFPWLLGMTSVDPLGSQHKMDLQTDWPDIDFDCLPTARDHIKAYAADKYGSDKTCSVGTWMTYKFRSALQDVVRAMGGDSKEVIALTTNLPDDVDDLKDGGAAPCLNCKTEHKVTECPKCGSEEVDGTTIGQLIKDYANLAAYNDVYPEIVDMAVRMVGKIKALGTHAGGLIIADRPLFGNVPMAFKEGKWTSLWTEGRSPQLSKFGYVKWDVLGLKTLQYIHECCMMLAKTRGLKFDAIPWARQDREKNILGIYSDKDGVEHQIRMDDEEVFEMLNDLRIETVFQFDTDVQRGILSNGVRDYYDLQVFNAMGHPGPMDFIPEYAKRRDDVARRWMEDEHPEIANMLLETHGIICYQEQLAALWMKFAGFTAPEAEGARKAVAKKWKDKLKPVREQWIKGSSKLFGVNYATKLWDDRMEPFGRYAFNKSHSTSYIMVAFISAWMKVHFPPEWWGSVMSSCHHEKLVKYMNIARSEDVQFGTINVENISLNFTVEPGTLRVTPGLTSIKGIGEGTAGNLQETARAFGGSYTDIDHFVSINGKNKTILQRLILLGAFKRYHSNIKATWMWYQYKYCSDTTDLKKEIRGKLLADWTEEKIVAERERQVEEFRKAWPKRKKIPAKILNWQPKPKDSRENVMALYPEDYNLKERLQFEKEYLGYYWHSPMDQYHRDPSMSIRAVKEAGGGAMQAVIEKAWYGKTKRDSSFARLTVSDGLGTANVILWSEELAMSKHMIADNVGVKLYVDYDKERDSFTLRRRTVLSRLETIEEYQARLASNDYGMVEVVEEYA